MIEIKYAFYPNEKKYNKYDYSTKEYEILEKVYTFHFETRKLLHVTKWRHYKYHSYLNRANQSIKDFRRNSYKNKWEDYVSRFENIPIDVYKYIFNSYYDNGYRIKVHKKINTIKIVRYKLIKRIWVFKIPHKILFG